MRLKYFCRSKKKGRKMLMENILFILTDQWRADCTGYRNHPIVKTPNLDKLAKKSVDFENSFTVIYAHRPEVAY